MKKVLVTCPPMLGLMDKFQTKANDLGLHLYPANTTQTLSEDELCELLPDYDGWIIGDDPATYRVFKTAKDGKLKAAVKWGVGVDNVDFSACKLLCIPIANTPAMFGAEVADLAICYLLGLARQSFYIDREIRQNYTWPKPAGISISGKTIGIVGFGDIGYHTAKRLSGFDVNVIIYDPAFSTNRKLSFVRNVTWPQELTNLDYLVFTCSLTESNYHMLNRDTLALLKETSFVVNVARGPLIDEEALIEALVSKKIRGAALDVFEIEPLASTSPLRDLPQCIFGSHNGSNTVEAVERASNDALDKLAKFLK